MSKKLTLKDFIKYNSPCISCGGKPKIQLSRSSESLGESARLICNIVGNELLCDFKITFKSIKSLAINCTTNAFNTNYKKDFQLLIKDNILYLESICKCGSYITSENISFNLSKNILEPLLIRAEYVVLQDEKDTSTIFTGKETTITKMYWQKSIPTFSKTVPIMPLYKFKNRKELLDKIKLIITFS